MMESCNSRDNAAWCGVHSVSVTPFTETGAIDIDGFRNLMRLSSADRVHGVVVAGSTGEFYSMTAAERRRLVEVATEEVADGVSVVAGISALDRKEVIQLGKDAKLAGADGVMLLPPIFLFPNEAEIRGFVIDVSEGIDLPIMLYNNPRRTGVTLSPELVAQLADDARIVAIKDSSRDIVQVEKLVSAVGERVKVLVGFDSMLLASLSVGAHGVVSMASQVLGATVRDLYEAWHAGDLAAARTLQERLTRFYDTLVPDVSPYAVIKQAMNLLGRPGGVPRKPMLPVTPEVEGTIRGVLDELQMSN